MEEFTNDALTIISGILFPKEAAQACAGGGENDLSIDLNYRCGRVKTLYKGGKF